MDHNWWSLAVSVAALLVSAVSIGMTIRSNKDLQAKQHQFEIKLRQKIALENAKLIVTRNVASINGIMNAALITEPDNVSQDFLEEPFRLYAEVRDTYRGIEHYFNDQSRKEINQKLDEIEGAGAFETFMSQSITPELIQNCLSIPQLILQKIDENLALMPSVSDQ